MILLKSSLRFNLKTSVRIILTVCIFVIAGNNVAFSAEWEMVDFPLRENISGISIVHPDTIHMVTSGGKHARSYDGGKSWWGLFVTDNIRLEDVDFSDGTHGIAVGHKGRMSYTTNGGASWIACNWPDTNAIFISARQLDKSSAIATGMVGNGNGFRSGLGLRTSDNCQTWSSFTLPGQAIGDMYVFENGKIVCLSIGFMNTSLDSGQTWDSKRATDGKPGRLAVFSDKFGLIVGNSGMVASSKDGGKSWAPYDIVEDDINLTTAVFVNDSVAYIGGTKNTLMKLINFKSFEPITLPEEFNIWELEYDGRYLWAVGSNGKIARLKTK